MKQNKKDFKFKEGDKVRHIISHEYFIIIEYNKEFFSKRNYYTVNNGRSKYFEIDFYEFELEKIK